MPLWFPVVCSVEDQAAVDTEDLNSLHDSQITQLSQWRTPSVCCGPPAACSTEDTGSVCHWGNSNHCCHRLLGEGGPAVHPWERACVAQRRTRAGSLPSNPVHVLDPRTEALPTCWHYKLWLCSYYISGIRVTKLWLMSAIDPEAAVFFEYPCFCSQLRGCSTVESPRIRHHCFYHGKGAHKPDLVPWETPTTTTSQGRKRDEEIPSNLCHRRPPITLATATAPPTLATKDPCYLHWCQPQLMELHDNYIHWVFHCGAEIATLRPAVSLTPTHRWRSFPTKISP